MDSTNRSSTPIPEISEVVKKVTVSRGVGRYRSYIFQSYMFVAVIAFFVLAFFARTVPYFPIDLTITRSIQYLHYSWFNFLMQLISLPGYSPQAAVLALLFIGFLYSANLKWEAAVGAGNALISTLLISVLKNSIHRQRPNLDLVNVLINLKDPGFPSGHVFFYTAFFGYLFFLTYSLIQLSIKRTVLLISFGLLILLVGPSRIYLGEHWASDVLGAYLLGSVILLLSVYFYRWGKPRFFK
jgi:membrane-associated phospholipid phosphatase